jgi:hypothetical protein
VQAYRERDNISEAAFYVETKNHTTFITDEAFIGARARQTLDCMDTSYNQINQNI